MSVPLRRWSCSQLHLQPQNPAEAFLSEYPWALFLSPGTPISRLAFDLFTEPRSEPAAYPCVTTAIRRSPARTGFPSQPLATPGFVRPLNYRISRRVPPRALCSSPASITCPFDVVLSSHLIGTLRGIRHLLVGRGAFQKFQKPVVVRLQRKPKIAHRTEAVKTMANSTTPVILVSLILFGVGFFALKIRHTNSG